MFNFGALHALCTCEVKLYVCIEVLGSSVKVKKGQSPGCMNGG